MEAAINTTINTIINRELKKNNSNINISTGIFGKNLTDKDWQEVFTLLRSYIKENNDTLEHYSSVSTLKCRDTKIHIRNMLAYHSKSKYATGESRQYYYYWIVDIVDMLFSRKKEFCYSVEQVYDLLRIFPDRLRSRYNQEGEYVIVWLA